ncbi:hypothetical protein HK101_000298 [Irineochytrium annulatum]|nr:hypothetical protein HK101_000298 [Irineochytrium annulatum]
MLMAATSTAHDPASTMQDLSALLSRMALLDDEEAARRESLKLNLKSLDADTRQRKMIAVLECSRVKNEVPVKFCGSPRTLCLRSFPSIAFLPFVLLQLVLTPLSRQQLMCEYNHTFDGVRRAIKEQAHSVYEKANQSAAGAKLTGATDVDPDAGVKLAEEILRSLSSADLNDDLIPPMTGGLFSHVGVLNALQTSRPDLWKDLLSGRPARHPRDQVSPPLLLRPRPPVNPMLINNAASSAPSFLDIAVRGHMTGVVPKLPPPQVLQMPPPPLPPVVAPKPATRHIGIMTDVTGDLTGPGAGAGSGTSAASVPYNNQPPTVPASMLGTPFEPMWTHRRDYEMAAQEQLKEEPMLPEGVSPMPVPKGRKRSAPTIVDSDGDDPPVSPDPAKKQQASFMTANDKMLIDSKSRKEINLGTNATSAPQGHRDRVNDAPQPAFAPQPATVAVAGDKKKSLGTLSVGLKRKFVSPMLKDKDDAEDIAGLNHAKKTVNEVVVWPMLRPDIFTGIRGPPKGLLLFGPPGTGKTLIGKCIASQSKATFFSISSSSLTSKWIGDGEKMVRALFAVARVHQPSVIFIDEVDSLLTQRSDGEHEATRRIKTEFLVRTTNVQFDGCGTDADDRILMIGATNRPQEIDEAARRRFRKRLYVPLPEAEARHQMVTNALKKQTHSLTEEEINTVVKMTEGYSGSDMDGLVREAAIGPIRDIKDIMNVAADDVRPIMINDFIDALTQVKASVSDRDLDLYLKFDAEFGSASAVKKSA